MADAILAFAPLNGALDVGFLTELARRKLHEYRLSDAPVPITGAYARASRPEVASPLCVSSDAFADDASVPPSLCGARGTLINANTIDDFKEWDKHALIERAAAEIWADVASGGAWADPAGLGRFLLLTFADLKTHKFYYWFAFPAFALKPPPRARAPRPLADLASADATVGLRRSFALLAAAAGSPPGAPAYFAVRRTEDGSLDAAPLACWREWRAAGHDAWLAFTDPCPSASHPGWPLRNLLTLAAVEIASQQEPQRAVTVLCYREPPADAAESGGGSPAVSSLVFDVDLPAELIASLQQQARPAAVGWEKNAAGRAGARMMDLSVQLDATSLAKSAVELNLRLMRWRLMPALETEKVAATRCLLLGAGTLGCAVARCLLGWGVQTITFVDSGVVAYSNPVRQSLFNFDDCAGETRKAPAAAAALRRIYPGVSAEGHVLSIPMPGHAVGKAEAPAVASDVKRLAELIADCDVLYLLTDTRESRWLPTLLATAQRKLTVTVALGFDSYVVMRHGPTPPGDPPPAAPSTPAVGAPPSRLGCYFCNDVVAPANSMHKRTLDQQCTVSRPGLAYIASATAVELTVSLLHHPQGMDAPADIGADADAPDAAASPLGCVPHQIRGTLPFFRTDCMRGHAFERCTACSPCVIDAFESRGLDFLMDAFNRCTYLEDLTGLTQMHQETEAAIVDVDFFDDDGDDDF